MKIATTILAAAMMLPISVAHAIPNMWISSDNHGWITHLINTKDKVTFSLDCATGPDENNILQHSVYVELANGKRLWSTDEKTKITVVADDSQYPLPTSLGRFNSNNNWLSFIDALAVAERFDVYVRDKKVGTFTPGLKNAKKELGTLSECKEIEYSD